MSALRVNSGTAIASGEEVRAALRELHKRAALMQLQPAARDIASQQKRAIDLFDMDPALLDGFEGLSVLHEAARSLFGIGAGAV